MNVINDYTPNRLTGYKSGSEQVSRVTQESAAIAPSRPTVQPEPRVDSVQLSDDAKLLAAADRVARDGAEAHADKIARLRAEVSSGTYTADSRRIAEGLVREEFARFIA